MPAVELTPEEAPETRLALERLRLWSIVVLQNRALRSSILQPVLDCGATMKLRGARQSG